MNLEQLRKQAKELVRAARAGEVEALERLRGREAILARAMSALYGAAGVAHDPELTRVLLEAGANPDDGESLYHSTEASSTDCLRLLLEHGAQTKDTNALAHALDGEHLEHGADLDRPGGETWRGNVPLRTPYQHAVLRGREGTAAVLAELGASTELDPADEAVAALARGERPSVAVPGQLDPDPQEVIVLAALRGHLDGVLDTVGPDFRGVVGGSPEGSLLNHAAWVGSPELVGALLERGADPLPAVGTETGTPLAWAAHGSQYHWQEERRDYVAVAELLAGVGVSVDATLLDTADGRSSPGSRSGSSG